MRVTDHHDMTLVVLNPNTISRFSKGIAASSLKKKILCSTGKIISGKAGIGVLVTIIYLDNYEKQCKTIYYDQSICQSINSSCLYD